MACYHPQEAYLCQTNKKLVFNEVESRKWGGVARILKIPCGKCLGCCSRRQADWAQRCMNEAAMHQVNSFVTLTYDEKHTDASLNYTDFRLFIKRLRKAKGTVRYFAAGEYGTLNNRPHFHALLFGVGFGSLQKIGQTLWRSPELEALWKAGFSSIGEVTPQSAAYVAGYCTKKHRGIARLDPRTGELLEPEKGTMSLKPGLGETWIKKHWRDVYEPRDAIVHPGGRQTMPPRYYDKKLMEINADLRESKDKDRYEKAKRYIEDQTTQRLETREKVHRARLEMKRKKL